MQSDYIKIKNITKINLFIVLSIGCDGGSPQHRQSLTNGQAHKTPSANSEEKIDNDTDNNTTDNNNSGDTEEIAAQPELISGSFLTTYFENGSNESEILIQARLENDLGPIATDILKKYVVTARLLDLSSPDKNKDLDVNINSTYLVSILIDKSTLIEKILLISVKDESMNKQDDYKLNLKVFSGNPDLTNLNASTSIKLSETDLSSLGTLTTNSYCDKEGLKNNITAANTTSTIDISQMTEQVIEFGTADNNCFQNISSPSSENILEPSSKIFPLAAWGPINADGDASCIFALMSNKLNPETVHLQIFSVTDKSLLADTIMTIHAHSCTN